MKKQEKNLKEPINFTRYIALFLLGFFFYSSGMISVLVLAKQIYTFQDFVIVAFPIPCFIFVIIWLMEKDEQIKYDNIILQKEIDRIKEIHDSRKDAEKYFD